MKKTIKLMAIVAIAAIGCTAGLQTLSSNSEDKPSAMILANVEALTNSETVTDCDAYCTTDPNYACVLYYSWGETYCLNKSQRL